MTLYAILFKRDQTLIEPFLFAGLESDDPGKVANHFFMMLQRNEHYREEPNRPLKKIYVSDVRGILPNFSSISQEKKQAIADGIMDLIKEYVSQSTQKEVVTPQ